MDDDDNIHQQIINVSIIGYEIELIELSLLQFLLPNQQLDQQDSL